MPKKSAEVTKDDRIKAYAKKLRRLIRDIPAERASLAGKIIEEIAFQTATLEDLRDVINILSEITGGQITTHEVLGNIFTHFCVGK